MKVEHKVEKKRMMQMFEYFFMGRAKEFFSAPVASHTCTLEMRIVNSEQLFALLPLCLFASLPAVQECDATKASSVRCMHGA